MTRYEESVSRNRGFVSEQEQSRLSNASVAIAGAGGDGGQVALILARLGVQRFRLADPEEFEVENLNRQVGSYVDTLGRNKAEAVADVIRRINPDAEVEVFSDGVTEDCIDEFVGGTDVVVDETEFTTPAIGVMIARAARGRSLPVSMGLNIGFGCLVTTFSPTGTTFESYLGLSETADLDEIALAEVGLDKWVPRLPAYAHEQTLRAVQTGKISAPSVSPGVAMAGGLLATEVFNVLTGRQAPVLAPRSIWMDAMERRARIIRNRSLSFNASAARLVLRSRRGKNVC